MMKTHLTLAAVLALAAVAAQADPLADGFADPPASARPRVWWHWMDGNVTKDGIAKDLAWMKRAGIGGMQMFDAALQTPQVVDNRLVYMSPGWKDALRFAASTADRLGLEMAIAASPGWSETGGPWVPALDAMKKLVWSETMVRGGKRFTGRLPAPSAMIGPFQSASVHDPMAALHGGGGSKPATGFYADAVVLAYPAAANEPMPRPVVTSEGGNALDAAALFDADLETGVDVQPGTPGRPGSILFTYPSSRTIRAATLFITDALPPFGDPKFTPVLEAQVGGGWRKVVDLDLGGVPTTVSFAPVTARAFRVVMGPYTGPHRPGLGEGAPGAIVPQLFPGPPAGTPLRVVDLRLSADAAVDRFEAKAGFAIARDYDALASTAADADGVAPADVVDLTQRMRVDGTLDWTPPPGTWRVIRLGYSQTGTTNHPAPAEATGFEVDKYDAAAVRRYLETYLARYRDAAGPDLIGARGIRALLTDSTEVGPSNWTPRLIEHFRRLRGYDPMPWLPALTGVVVASRRRSDAFLSDFRRTLADLHASEHYGTVAAVAHENGLTLYGEALEDQRPTLGDDMAMRRHADVPMAAMWTFNRGSSPRPTLLADTKGAASVAHVYGQNIVAAESLTAANSPWAFAPADLKPIIDLEFTQGINRPVIHTSVHQPNDAAPGLSLAIFGQYFNRHESWAEMARPWVDYIARSSFLLQQGHDVADVAYFYGEEGPLTALYGMRPVADAPVRHAYDFVNADVVLNRLTAQGGELVVPGGARYRLLYLGGASERMTLPVLRRIAALAEGGATIVGTAPRGSPSLGDDSTAYDALVRRLWSGASVTRVGTGRVVAGRDVEAALASIGVPPDFSYTKSASDSDVRFVHRRIDDGDIYFLNNRQVRAERIEARFRVTGKQPELWSATTGRVVPVSYRTEGGSTVVPLDLLPEDALFVVFRKPATAPAADLLRPDPQPVATLPGPWTVAFQPGRGAPASTRLTALSPLNESADTGIRYFSGVATYTTSFDRPRGPRRGAPLMIDLGQVSDLAEVLVNGTLVGTAWVRPFRVDIGRAVRPGRNRVEVRVANLWVNRLIGDQQPGATKIAVTAAPTYRPNAPLRPSGLIGPVTILGPSPTP